MIETQDCTFPLAGTVEVYQLKVELAGVKPSIWRRLEVRGDINLGLLHAVLQVTMGWTNSHLHEFVMGDEHYSDPRINREISVLETPHVDENETLLIHPVPQENAQFIYNYDFGDSWEHVITVEKIRTFEEAINWPARCLAGSRACPPEDCGGVQGYENLLTIIRDPKHEEHKSMMTWLGGEFDPEAFDLKKVNTFLCRLKCPRTTSPQLAKIIEARDRVR